uniref:Putative ovule protein n=1 Tax=Solanum chacoense TaxID=4108 RepID=A0A0V0IHZ7_SOLCH
MALYFCLSAKFVPSYTIGPNMPVVTKIYKNAPILDGIPKIKQKYPISPKIIHSSLLIRLNPLN